MYILEYFFTPLPSAQFPYLKLLIAIAFLLLAASVALRIVIKKMKEDKVFKKTFRALPGKLQTLSIFEFLYIICRYLQLPFLSARILNGLILGIAAFLIIKNLIVYFKQYPETKKEYEKQKQLNKYIPRKKHS